MNEIFFSGRLTRDAEFKAFANGRMVARVSIANNRIYNKADGTQGNETTYLEVDVFAKSFDNVRGILVKGQPVSMHGRLRCEEWIDKTGQKRSKLCAICSLYDMNFHMSNIYGGGDGNGQNGGGMPAFQMGADGGYANQQNNGGGAGYGGGYAPQQGGGYPQYQQQMPPQGQVPPPPQGHGGNPQYQPQQAGAAQYQPAEQSAQPQPPQPPVDDNTPF